MATSAVVAFDLKHLTTLILEKVVHAKDLRLTCAIVATMMRTTSAMSSTSTMTTSTTSTTSDSAPHLNPLTGAGRRRRRAAARQRRKTKTSPVEVHEEPLHSPEPSDAASDSVYDDFDDDVALDANYLTYMAEAAQDVLREEQSKSTPPEVHRPSPRESPAEVCEVQLRPSPEPKEHLVPTPASRALAYDAELRLESERLREEMLRAGSALLAGAHT